MIGTSETCNKHSIKAAQITFCLCMDEGSYISLGSAFSDLEREGIWKCIELVGTNSTLNYNQINESWVSFLNFVLRKDSRFRTKPHCFFFFPKRIAAMCSVHWDVTLAYCILKFKHILHLSEIFIFNINSRSYSLPRNMNLFYVYFSWHLKKLKRKWIS